MTTHPVTLCRHCEEEVHYEEMSGTWQHGGVDPYRNDLSVCPGTTRAHEPEADDDDFTCAYCGDLMSEHRPDDLFGDPRHPRCRRCPLGGPHAWVTESPDDYYLATGVRRSTRQQRTHCESCGASAPDQDEEL